MDLKENEEIVFDEYLTSAPILPRELGENITKFFYHVALPIEDIKSMATITQFIGEPEFAEKRLTVFLNIEVYKSNKPKSEDFEKEVWDLLDQFREHKNKVFFSMLTQKTLEGFR